ncbi:DNA-binding response regulator, partial [Pandoraea pneumonica]
IVGALQRGATGYLLKEREDTEIALSIRSALRGGAPIDPFVARHILGLVALAPGVSGTPVPPSGTGSGLAAARMSDVPSALSP